MDRTRRPDARETRSAAPAQRPRSLKLLAYGVSQNRLRRSSKALSVPVILTEDLAEADALITLKSYYRKRPSVISDAEERRTPVYVLRSNTYAQIEQALIDLFGMHTPQNRLSMALDETRNAIRDVERGTRRMVELAPQVPEIRKQQHELVRSANLRSLSNGNDPHRRVRVYRA